MNARPQGYVTGLIWRFEDKPEEWIMTLRFRYYRGAKI